MPALTRFNSIYSFIPSKARFFTLCRRKPRVAYSAVVSYCYEGWINPWTNARRVSPVALAKEDTLRRVTPDEACGGCHGRRPVGFTTFREFSKRGRMVSIRLIMRPKGNTLATG